MSYDFKSLSSLDFEILVRDLLQAELGIRLESFKSGRDGGIDLRYSQDSTNALIVQCKHYSKFSDLIRVVKDEKGKVEKLKPDRYILATSLSCTPEDKGKIRDALSPFCKSTSDDVYSAEDINNLLTKHPEIERHNFKLWLSSVSVMERVLQSEMFVQSESEIRRIKQKIHTYVQNESFLEAQEIINKNHYCIISGIPGIGKTTLAEMLLIHYLNQDFEIFKISSDIEDAYKVFNKAQKQIFYYDDFLGQTTLVEKLNKNEDQRLLQFIDDCVNSRTTLFILTTREYILNQAKLHYERLDISSFDINKCVVDLSKYTIPAKAKILFNHLYYSKVPLPYLHALVVSKKYDAIVNHKNYSPRIIEWMTETQGFSKFGADEYADEFIKSLDNPIRIWKHAYEHQIQDDSRYILLCLVTLPAVVLLEHLEKVFLAISTPVEKSREHKIRKTFMDALKELDGNFISIERKWGKSYVQFHNPSIRDFMESYVLESSDSIGFLYSNCVYFDQLAMLHKFSVNKDHLIDDFVNALLSNFNAENCKIQEYSDETGKSSGRYCPQMSLENKLSYLFMWQTPQLIATGFINKIIANVESNIRNGVSNKHDLLNLLRRIASIQDEEFNFESLISNSKELFLKKLDDIDDFDNSISFAELFNDLDAKEVISLLEKFENSLQGLIEQLFYDADPVYIDDQVSTLKKVSRYLEIDISENLTEIYKYIEELENKIDDQISSSYEYDDEIEPDIDFESFDMNNMFELLLDPDINNVQD